MSGGLPVVTVSLQVLIGVVLAVSLLYAIKQLNQNYKLAISVLGLLIAVALYVLLAVLTGNPVFIAIEVVGLMLFLFLIWLGYYYSLWFIAVGWLLHVLWDVGLQPAQTAPYIPQWYTWLCVGFDIVMAIYVGTIVFKVQQNSNNRQC
ncbi:hypothetical protein [Kaarinaea lacus]